MAGYPAANDSEVTLKDVMELLKTIDGKVSAGGDKLSAPDDSAARKPTTDFGSPQVRPANAPPVSWADPAVIERVMYTKDQIVKRVEELAASVSVDYSNAVENEFVVVGLLAGVYMFMGDFTRHLTVPHQVDFVAASSYGLAAVSSADVKIKKDLDTPISGKDVLILDEMCDTGRTMASLKQLLLDRGAKSVRVCVMLNKATRREVEVQLDYVGFECEDEFLVGYGMDWAHRFRSLPDICVVAKSAYMK